MPRSKGASLGGNKMPNASSGRAYGKIAQEIQPGRARGEAVSTAAKMAGQSRERIQPIGKGLQLKNAPIFKGPSDPSEGGGVPDKLKEPLDPPGFSLPGAGGLKNLKALHQNQQGHDPVVKDLSLPAAIQDSDFHQGGFSKGTGHFLKTGGVA